MDASQYKDYVLVLLFIKYISDKYAGVTLSSFYQKITLAHALRMINVELRDDLHIVRNIRNAFAHSRRLLSFDHALVVQELRKFKSDKKIAKEAKLITMDAAAARTCYLSICYNLSLKLIRKHNRAIARSNKQFEKKYPYARGLLGAGNLP